jgi:hypothetical protein
MCQSFFGSLKKGRSGEKDSNDSSVVVAIDHVRSFIVTFLTNRPPKRDRCFLVAFVAPDQMNVAHLERAYRNVARR